jgi:hypothetical protein
MAAAFAPQRWPALVRPSTPPPPFTCTPVLRWEFVGSPEEAEVVLTECVLVSAVHANRRVHGRARESQVLTAIVARGAETVSCAHPT